MYKHYPYYIILVNQHFSIWFIKSAKNATFSFLALCLMLKFFLAAKGHKSALNLAILSSLRFFNGY